jgi:ribosome-associated protein
VLGDCGTFPPLLSLVLEACESKLGRRTVALDVSGLIPLTDLFVITSAPNKRQVQAISDEVMERLKRSAKRIPLGVEGYLDAEWVLIDYGEVVVHVFLEEARELYDLERLWADAPRLVPPVDAPPVAPAATPLPPG